MRAPAFWDQPDAWQGRLMAPLGAVTAWATARRLRRQGISAGVPVICVGNLHAGGTGKTPVVIAVLERLAALGIAAHVVSRGYGGRLAGPLRVADHPASDVGDEPRMLTAFAPVWVARDRAAGVKAAVAAGAGAIVLDDGFQNPAVTKDLALVVVDAASGFGNGRCLPAGPLREPVAVGLARANLLVSIGDAAAQTAFCAAWGAAMNVPLLIARIEPLNTGMPWAGLPAMAFAGIGRPDKFFATLRGLGADVRRTVALDDHAPISTALFDRMEAEARSLGAQLVTTEKDAARLTAGQRARVTVLPVRLVFDDPAALDRRLAALFADRPPPPGRTA
jgi:tetraacyldisaccharide 4'-kinase